MLSKLAGYKSRHHLALLALFVALGGTSYATVVNVPRNSVGTPELKRNAVKAAKIAPNAVRTGHVLDGSLLSADFKPGQIPQGPKGDKGDKGDRGDAGATNVVVRTQSPCPNGLPTNVHCVTIPRCEAGGARRRRRCGNDRQPRRRGAAAELPSRLTVRRPRPGTRLSGGSRSSKTRRTRSRFRSATSSARDRSSRRRGVRLNA